MNTTTEGLSRQMLLARVRTAANLTVENVRFELGDDAADMVAASLEEHLSAALS